jgi:hypothetical protein
MSDMTAGSQQIQLFANDSVLIWNWSHPERSRVSGVAKDLGRGTTVLFARDC